jgi:hypothetical protein
MFDDEEREPALADWLMASGMMLEAFMLEISLQLARKRADPQDWARSLISSLTARIDANEQRMDDRHYPMHELARQGFDRLGRQLAHVLTAQAGSPGTT